MKRFTETSKWTQDRWFIQLESKYKLLWLYMLDTCDNVGVWEETLFVAERLLQETFDKKDVIKMFEEKIKVLDDKKWWIRKFCTFQYGALNDTNVKNKPHQSYINLLKKHNLWIDYTRTIDSPKEKDKDKDKDIEKDMGLINKKKQKLI